MRMTTGAAMVALVAAMSAGGAGARAETLAVMPVKLLDTSQEQRDQAAEHARRLDMVGAALAADMKGAGPYGDTVLVSPETVAAACPDETAACLIAAARAAGGDQALFTVVQKSSTLIMQVFAHVVDVGDNALVVSRDLNFRGDTDESWMRMEGFLARTLADATVRDEDR
jgi:hypothetical protein